MIASDEKLLAVFELMARKLGVRYDRSELRKQFSAAELAGSDPLDTLYRVAERYRLRLGVFDCGLDEALQFVRQGYPIAIAPTSEDSEGPAGTATPGESADDWWVLLDIGRRGVKTWSTRIGGGPTRRTIRSLRASFGSLGQAASSRRLIVAQPLDAMLMGHRDEKPLARFFSLLRPDAADILAVIVFAIVVGVLSLATPLAVESMVNTVAFNRYFQPIIVLSILLCAFLTFAAILTIIMTVVSEIIQRRLFVRIGIDLGHRLSNVDTAALDGYHGPELVNRFLDISVVQKAVASMLLDGVTLVISVLIGMTVLAVYHPFLLGFDISLLALMAFMIFVLGRGAVKSSMKESKEKFRLLAWLEDVVANPTAFRLHGGDILAMDRTDQMAAHYVELRKAHFSVLLRQIAFAVSVQVIASVALLSIGGWLVIRNQLTLGQLVAAELIVTVIVGAFAKMGKHLETFYDLMASIEKLGKILDLPEADVGGHHRITGDGPLNVQMRDLVVGAGGKTVIQGFSAHLMPGRSAVLIGPPGCGKSLLLETLATLRAPQSGTVEVNEIDLRRFDHAQYTQNIGYARDIEIFTGTVGENIDLHRPEIHAQEVQAALHMVGLSDEIRQLEDSVDTELVSGGRPLSATQCARLMIARAIVGRPRLLLIDGLLDCLPQKSAQHVVRSLHMAPMPWSLVVTTARTDILEYFSEEWTLGPVR